MLQKCGTFCIAKYVVLSVFQICLWHMFICWWKLSIISWIRFSVYDMIEKRNHQLTPSAMLMIPRAPIPINHHHKYHWHHLIWKLSRKLTFHVWIRFATWDMIPWMTRYRTVWCPVGTCGRVGALSAFHKVHTTSTISPTYIPYHITMIPSQYSIPVVVQLWYYDD